MGEDAVEAPDGALDDVVVVKEPESSEDGSPSEDEGSETPQQFDVVRQGAEGSQPKVKNNAWIPKRINKIGAQRDTARDEADQSQADLAIEKEKNKLLQLALDQKNEAETIKPPNPDDFDEGVHDPKFIRDQNTYNQNFIASEVQKATANIQRNDEPAPNTELLSKQTKHYETAQDLGADDYAEVEDKALDILGNEIVNFIIQSSDSSPVILYYLGKNPDEAENIAELVKTNLGKAALQIGRLEVELKVRPKGKTEPTPDPDDEIEGGSPSANNTKQASYDAKLDTFRGDVASGKKTFSQLVAFKKSYVGKGVTI